MKVRDCMTRDVRVINPDSTIQEAARSMAENDTGALPVGENDRLIGMITDRDMVIRAICEGKGPDTTIRECMSQEVRYCYEDEDLEHVAQNMAELQVRRLPVLSREKRLVGIISLGDIAMSGDERVSAQALHGISRHSDKHNQGAHRH